MASWPDCSPKLPASLTDLTIRAGWVSHGRLSLSEKHGVNLSLSELARMVPNLTALDIEVSVATNPALALHTWTQLRRLSLRYSNTSSNASAVPEIDLRPFPQLEEVSVK